MTIKRLPDSELEVMLAVWQAGGSTHTGDIVKAVSSRRSASLQSVQNYLSRLVSKGFLSTHKQDRVNYYTPLISREDYLAAETDSFISKLFDNSPAELVARLVQDRRLTPTEIAEIRKILDEGEA